MEAVLHHFYRLEVDEATIIDKIGLKNECSFADLARVMEEYSLKAVALNFDHLQRMMLPAIEHSLQEDSHIFYANIYIEKSRIVGREETETTSQHI